MKPSEFYQKYWKVVMPDGTVAPVRQLTQAEANFLDSAANDENIKGVMFFRKRRRTITIDVEIIKQHLDKLPSFFK